MGFNFGNHGSFLEPINIVTHLHPHFKGPLSSPVAPVHKPQKPTAQKPTTQPTPQPTPRTPITTPSPRTPITAPKTPMKNPVGIPSGPVVETPSGEAREIIITPKPAPLPVDREEQCFFSKKTGKKVCPKE